MSISTNEFDNNSKYANEIAKEFGIDLALPPELAHNSEIMRALEVSQQLLEVVDSAHGRGEGEVAISTETGYHMAYHHGGHSRDVIAGAVEHLLMSGETDTEVFAIAIMAAAGHDIVQSQGSGTNEELSAAYTADALRDNGYDDTIIMRSEQAILGTTLRFSPELGGCVQDAYESNDPVTTAVAIGDLGRLAQYDAPEHCLRLFVEQHSAMLPHENLSYEQAIEALDTTEGQAKLADYLVAQQAFYNNFHYPLAVGDLVDNYYGHRVENGALLADMGRRVAAGQMSVRDVYDFVRVIGQE